MKSHVSILGISTFLFLMPAYPSSDAQDREDDMTIEQVSPSIDKESHKLGGIKVVSEQLKRQFHINDDVIFSLRERKITYGDINTVLALAEQMPGSVNDENINEIVGMRQGKMGNAAWDRIAGYLGVETKPVIRRTKMVVSALASPVELSRSIHRGQSDQKRPSMLIKDF